MKTYQHFIIIAGMFLLLFSSSAFAQKNKSLDIPRTISYQGLLTSTNGTPLPDGRHTIIVTLYGNEEGKDIIWQDRYEAFTNNGVFNLYLGNSTHPLPNTEAMNRPLWVGTKVDGSEEMYPLTPLAASPYALNLPDHAVTTGKLADGAVTAEKVKMDYVAKISVDGKDLPQNEKKAINLQSTDDFSFTYDENTGSISVVSTERSHSSSDKEKGNRTLASPLAWDSQGDLTDGTIGGQNTTSGDWIGTSSAAGNGEYNFIVKVNSQQIMKYQPNGTNTPNIVGGNSANSVTGLYGSTIGGGGSTTLPNTISGTYAVIGGGEGNSTANLWSTIGGGHENTITGSGGASAIGGGGYNSINLSWNGTIGGGFYNDIDDAESATIAGGDNNQIKKFAYKSFIGGGESNIIYEGQSHTVIGGGEENTVGDAYFTIKGIATIGGGKSNTLNGWASTISGGIDNTIATAKSAIGGGSNNRIAASNQDIGASTISGGGNNSIYGYTNTIGGGASNIIGDESESLEVIYSVVGGGINNSIQAEAGSILGGDENVVSEGANYSSIGGGSLNNTAGEYATISGGLDNLATGNSSTIGGGTGHSAAGDYSTIGGGAQNTIPALIESSTIGGGYLNQVTNTGGAPIYSFFTISGGNTNIIKTNASSQGFATIGGGNINRISEAGHMATIPGGDMLTAQSWAQTVVGGLNIAKGNVGFRKNGATTNDLDGPIFIVGNGSTPMNRSNAFEVSYNGHSIVFDENGSGGWKAAPGRGAVQGATYRDNVIYGWAEVSATGSAQSSCGEFGVQSITHTPGSGVYTVTLNVVGPDGLTPAFINCGAVTATLGSGQAPTGTIPASLQCAQITTSKIVNNVFDVYVTQVGPMGHCDLGVDLPFKFHVTGRVD